MELKWIAQANPLQTGNHFFEEFDLAGYTELSENFKKLPNTEKSKYKGIEDYITTMGGLTLTPTQKNYKKFMDEIISNLDLDAYYNILPVNIYSEKETIIEAQSPAIPRLKRSRCRSSQEVNDSPTPFSAFNYCLPALPIASMSLS